jgi:hypothetical protein
MDLRSALNCTAPTQPPINTRNGCLAVKCLGRQRRQYGAAAVNRAAASALYHRRWTIEESFDDLKTRLADRKVILRSKRPEQVKQEFYALLLAHATIRKLMTEAADRTQQSAVDLSCASSSAQAALGWRHSPLSVGMSGLITCFAR